MERWILLSWPPFGLRKTIFLSSGSIEPGQRPRDSQEASHVSETQLSLGIALGTLPTPTQDKILKAMETIRKKG